MDTYYTLLGVTPDASQQEIEQAYQRQRERYSVERVAEMDEDIRQIAQKRTADIEHSYRVLSDPEQRHAYDASIGQQPGVAQPAQQTRRSISPREWGYMAGGVGVALLLVALLWIMTDSTDLPSVGEVNRPAPDFSLPALMSSEDVQLQAYRGQVVLVNFWGTWCEPCERETPALQNAYEQLRDQGLMVVGINLTQDELLRGNTEEDIQAFVQQYHVTYPIALDTEGKVAEAFRLYPLPTSYFIDTQGNIRYVRVGELTTDEVTALFRQLQQEAAAHRE
jgi:peroxiredoxin